MRKSFIIKRKAGVIMNLSLKVEVFKEGDVYVALSPELNVSSFGDTVEDARHSLTEAIMIYVEGCEELGTLEEVLEEAGFSQINDAWKPRKPLFEEELALAV